MAMLYLRWMRFLTPLVDEVVFDGAALSQFFDRLAELMPEAAEIGRLHMADLSYEEITDIIGVNPACPK